MPTGRLARAFPWVVWLGLVAVCAQGLWKPVLWKSAEPRVMTIARAQHDEGLVRSLTFAGMPFLEQPPFYFDLTALAFRLAGGPSIPAARAVVALLGIAWLASLVAMARHAAGARAGLLAGALAAVSTAVLPLVRRLGVDICLVSMLAVALLCLYRAVATDGPRVGGRWWWGALAAAGCAALTKGLFGSFLFVVPTLAYAALARDGRVLRALFRPSTLAALLAPHLAWGLVLYRDGGWTFVFEHFVNNTIGRVLHVRYEVEGTGDLAYGDVGVPYPWYYFLKTIPLGALPAVLMVPSAIASQRARGRFRARDPASRLVALGLCWGCVPPLLLSFSTYKGRDHLGAGTTALVVVGAIELARRLPDPWAPGAPRGALAGVCATYALAPLVALAGFFGRPATEAGVRAIFGLAGAALVLGLAAAWRARRPGIAVWSLLAALAVAFVADFSPGSNLRDDARNTLDPVARWVADEAGDLPVAVYYPRGVEEPDEIGRAHEQVIGSLSYWLGRPVTRLRTQAEVSDFLADGAPGYVFARQDRDHRLEWPAGEAGVGWLAVGGNRDDAFLIVANRARARLRPAPATQPPDAGARAGG